MCGAQGDEGGWQVAAQKSLRKAWRPWPSPASLAAIRLGVMVEPPAPAEVFYLSEFQSNVNSMNTADF